MMTMTSPPITFVHLGPIIGITVIHAVIVEAIEFQSDTVYIVDPAYSPTGRREWTLGQFEAGWRLARYQTLLVQLRG